MNKFEKLIEKRQNFMRQTVFALICTIFIGFAWNSRFQFKMDNTPFNILWPNIDNFFYNNLFLRQSGSKENSDKNKNSLQRKKKIIVIIFVDVGS